MTMTTNALILVVDDTYANRLLIAYLLRSKGHQVVEAADGEEALKYLHSGEPLPQLVVTDMFMPNISGYDLVQRLRSEFSTMPIPVVFSTAQYPLEIMQTLAQAASVEHLILLPATPEVIIDTVEAALAGAPSVGPPSRHVILAKIIDELRRFAKGEVTL